MAHMSEREFELFVGIDWSGAKGPRQPGLSVFAAGPGNSVPERVFPPDGRYWSRIAILDYLRFQATKKRVLAGIDFAFAYPVSDVDGSICGYFPGYPHSPETAHDLWALIDRLNAERPDLYGGGIWDHPQLGAYYNAPGGRRGTAFSSRRRLAEQVAREVKSPSPTFNCVGPAGVGTGSLAGMRALHQLSSFAHIWPFDNPDTVSRPLHLVEIFPSYYFALAGIKPVNGAHGERENINQALACFGSDPVSADFQANGPDHDEADALISAAALRWFSAQSDFWSVPADARAEGWIFGVKSATP